MCACAFVCCMYAFACGGERSVVLCLGGPAPLRPPCSLRRRDLRAGSSLHLRKKLPCKGCQLHFVGPSRFFWHKDPLIGTATSFVLQAKSLHECPFRGPTAFMMGNERGGKGQGITRGLAELTAICAANTSFYRTYPRPNCSLRQLLVRARAVGSSHCAVDMD